VPEGRWLCPAKVNLYLKVLARREDGYHDLVTVMQPLTLADELRLTPGGGLSLECRHPEVPSGDQNLVWRAAQKFTAAIGQEPQVHIRLVKNIPVAAGLGGGSSDAAGTLLALNKLTGTPLDSAALHSLAAELGADVPFFLRPGPAVGQGIGTNLSPLDLPPFWYVLLNPGYSISTRWVYANLDMEALAQIGAPFREAFNGERPEDWVANDLETVTVSRFSELRELLERLSQTGARAWGMSGSGPTLFGLFHEAESAQAAGARLRQNFSGWLAVARGLTQMEGETDWENQAWTI
jgi:4-diphosphocytidyl-2-C-methyl-D-erythritol kinase